MGDHIMGERERALENAFFAQRERDLLDRLREADRASARRAELAGATGLTDPAALEALDRLGLGAATVAALALAPMVLVAWADGKLDAAERRAVGEAAAAQGLAPGSAAAALLEGWLAAPPPPALAAAWEAQARALAAGLDPAARSALRDATVARARLVAEAAGGVLGLVQRVSPAEEAVLARLDRALTG